MGARRIAYFASYAPQPRNFGGRYRVEAIWRGLQTLEASVDFIIIGERPKLEVRKVLREAGVWILPPKIENRTAWVRRCVNALVTRKCIPTERFLNDRRRRELISWLKSNKPDVVVLGDTFLSPITPHLKQIGLAVVNDTSNVESRRFFRIGKAIRNPYMKLAYSLLALNIRDIEGRYLSKADHIWAASNEDAEWYRRVLKHPKVCTIPNVIDLSLYQPSRGSAANTIIYTGSYDYWPNQDAALRLIRYSRQLMKEDLEHTLYLVGRDPTRQMHKAARNHSQITITGEVPDTRPYFDQANLFAAPIAAGSGTKYKILEALASRNAVLTTPIGQEGLDLVAGRHIDVAPLERFYAVMKGLLNDRQRRNSLAINGHRWVCDNHSLQALQRSLQKAFGQGGKGDRLSFT